MKPFRLAAIAFSLISALALAGCVAIDTGGGGDPAEYPTKPITMMVSFRAGGGTDTQARVVAVTLEEELGQPINVVNNPGAGGTVGVQELLASEADGHTIAFVVTVAVVDNPILQGLDYNVDSLAVAAMMSTFQSAAVTRGDAPYESWDEFLAYAKENPGLKIPDSTLDALAAAAQVATESDAYAEVMAQLQFPITYLPAAEAQAELASQYERFVAANQ